jgi:hypothetical protein
VVQEKPPEKNYRFVLVSNDWIVSCIAYSGLRDLPTLGLGKRLLYDGPFKDEAQTALFKDPVRTAL